MNLVDAKYASNRYIRRIKANLEHRKALCDTVKLWNAHTHSAALTTQPQLVAGLLKTPPVCVKKMPLRIVFCVINNNKENLQ